MFGEIDAAVNFDAPRSYAAEVLTPSANQLGGNTNCGIDDCVVEAVPVEGTVDR